MIHIYVATWLASLGNDESITHTSKIHILPKKCVSWDTSCCIWRIFINQSQKFFSVSTCSCVFFFQYTFATISCTCFSHGSDPYNVVILDCFKTAPDVDWIYPHVSPWYQDRSYIQLISIIVCKFLKFWTGSSTRYICNLTGVCIVKVNCNQTHWWIIITIIKYLYLYNRDNLQVLYFQPILKPIMLRDYPSWDVQGTVFYIIWYRMIDRIYYVLMFIIIYFYHRTIKILWPDTMIAKMSYHDMFISYHQIVNKGNYDKQSIWTIE